MTLTPLSAAQLAALRVLVDTRAIEPVQPDPTRATAFLRKARVKCADLDNTQYHENRFDLAYGACHDVGEAVLAAYGYRTRSGPGQHANIGNVLAIVLNQPPGSVAAQRFDRLRRIRNGQNYRAHPVTQADAELAATSALQLIESAESRGLA